MKVVPEQIGVADALAVTGGAGTTQTWIEAVVVQPLALKVYTYVAKTELNVVLSSASLIFPVPEADGLLIPVTAVRLQLKVVPKTELVGEYEKR